VIPNRDFQYANNVQKMFIVRGAFVMFGALASSTGQVVYKTTKQKKRG
jgi:hypothetical protein